MRWLRWTSFTIGAAAFLGAHLVEIEYWRTWFEPGGAHSPWFLNNGPAAMFVLAVMFIAGTASGVTAAFLHQSPMMHSLSAGVGGSLAMVATLALTGGSTLAPLVIVIGAALLVSAAMLGSSLGISMQIWIADRGPH